MDDEAGMQRFDGVEREFGDRVDLSIIWLHGLGADASDFLPIVGQFSLPTAVRFVFPNAPLKAITINGGMVMRAWYDIAGFGPHATEDVDGLMQSVGIVRRLIQREVSRGIAPERIVLAGFSQGGAVVLHAGLTTVGPLGGILGLSTYLPAVRLFKAADPIASEIPVMLAHGTNDQVIPIGLAQQSAEIIRSRGIAVDWSTYPMGHEVSMQEIRDISEWLRRFALR
jgi:phospholipase/carboxylesterase